MVQQTEQLLVEMEQEVNVPLWSMEPSMGDLGQGASCDLSPESFPWLSLRTLGLL